MKTIQLFLRKKLIIRIVIFRMSIRKKLDKFISYMIIIKMIIIKIVYF